MSLEQKNMIYDLKNRIEAIPMRFLTPKKYPSYL